MVQDGIAVDLRESSRFLNAGGSTGPGLFMSAASCGNQSESEK
jgi:hypothetical protein